MPRKLWGGPLVCAGRLVPPHLHEWWGGPPGPRPTPPSACWRPPKMPISLFRQRDARVPRGPGGPPHSFFPTLHPAAPPWRRRARHGGAREQQQIVRRGGDDLLWSRFHGLAIEGGDQEITLRVGAHQGGEIGRPARRDQGRDRCAGIETPLAETVAEGGGVACEVVELIH